MARAALTTASTQLPPWTSSSWLGASQQGGPLCSLPNEVDGPLSLFVDFHGITEGGLLGILRTSYLRAVVSRARVWREQLRVCQGLFGKWVWKRGCSKCNAQRVLTQSARRAASMHVGSSSRCVCGAFGIHRSCKTVAEEWRWGGQRHCFTRVADQNGLRWTDYALGKRPCPPGCFETQS